MNSPNGDFLPFGSVEHARAEVARAASIAPPGLDVDIRSDSPDPEPGTEEEQVAAVADVVPWYPPDSLAGYLERAERFLCRYVAWPSEHEPVAVALWVALAHLVERFDVAPILSLTSAEKRSGKTRALEVLRYLVPAPWVCALPSDSAAFTMLSRQPRPTMLLDEADAIFGTKTANQHEGLRAILNAGYRRGVTVARVNMEGRRRQVEDFDVFGAKAIAGIGNLPDTVADRAIPIRMRRRAAGETVAKLRDRHARVEAEVICLDWAEVEVTEEADVPDELNDRAADSWEPLFAIADTAGGDWPIRARRAALALASEEDAPASSGIRLLSDIFTIFGGREYVASTELLTALHEIDDAPWGDWYGKPLTSRRLAELLAPYRVKPRHTRPEPKGQDVRAYFAQDLRDPWSRYVVGPSTSVTDATSATEVEVTAETVASVPGVTDIQGPTDVDLVPDALRIFGDDLADPRPNVTAADAPGLLWDGLDVIGGVA